MKTRLIVSKTSAIFITLSLAGSLANYLVYPFISRHFTTSQFGDFTLILSIFNQVLSILLAFNVISIALVKQNLEHEARFKAQAIQKALIWFFMAISILLLVFSSPLRRGLNIANPEYLFLLTLLLLVSVPSIIWSGYLQGHKKLVHVGIFLSSSAFLKLFFSIVLASYGGIAGGLFGVLVGITLATILLWATKPINLPSLRYVFKGFDPSETNFLFKARRYILGTLFVVGSLGVLQNIDIILSKAFFSPEIAGLYTGISIISKAIYFLSFLIIWLLLPNIVVGQSKHNQNLLKKAYITLAFIGVVTISAELLFGNLAISILLGDNFINISHLLVYATLYQLLLVGIAIYGYYLVVIGNPRGVILSFAVTICSIFTAALNGASPQALIQSLILGALLGLTVYMVISRFFMKADHSVQ